MFLSAGDSCGAQQNGEAETTGRGGGTSNPSGSSEEGARTNVEGGKETRNGGESQGSGR